MFPRNYSQLPERNSISIEEAVVAGLRDIMRPSKRILWISVMGGVVLSFAMLAFWMFPLTVAIGSVLSFQYTRYMTPKWRIWAYSGVADIHQFQRTAEMEGLLRFKSPFKSYGIMNVEQRKLLAQLQERFLNEDQFIDDANVPLITEFYARHPFNPFARGKLILTLNAYGITLGHNASYSWDNIQNDRIAHKTYHGTGAFSSGEADLGFMDFLCFDCPDGSIEISLKDLNVAPPQLDLMLTIYRGRHSSLPLIAIS